MLKTFIVGILLGVAAAVFALYAFPAVDQFREASIVAVEPNGGNTESFHVNVPIDRIMVGEPDRKQPLPAGMQWPADQNLQHIRVELFKVRNAKDAVVGIAARTAAKDGEVDVIDWVLHLPARGSVFASMHPQTAQDGIRGGELFAGSREFAPLKGFMTERWMPDTSGEVDAPAGRIELLATYVQAQEPLL